jgi:nucleotide-binding universal stress UspA family protein
VLAVVSVISRLQCGRLPTTIVTKVSLARHIPDIVKLAADVRVDLLVIGAVGNSALFERMIGSKADRNVQLAHCSVLVAK